MLEQHFVGRHAAFLVDLAQPPSDALQAGMLGQDLLLDLGLFQAHHAAQLGGRQVFAQELLDLLQRETQILERQDAVQTRQLLGGVVAVAAEAVDPGRHEQAELAVVPQGLDRYLGEFGEVTDLEHTGSTKLRSSGQKLVSVDIVLSPIGGESRGNQRKSLPRRK